jgi:hypothetical protein
LGRAERSIHTVTDTVRCATLCGVQANTCCQL